MCEYQNDGMPVFEKRSKRESFFLYFRGGMQRQWVIDTIITPSGAVFAKNETLGEDINGEWVMRGDWTVDPKALLVGPKLALSPPHLRPWP